MLRIISIFTALVLIAPAAFANTNTTITSQLSSIKNSVEQIRMAIASHNVNIPAHTPLAQYAGLIRQIQAAPQLPPGQINPNASSVILMIGDGFGINHVHCAANFGPTLLADITPHAWMTTYSYDCGPGADCVTDSAAATTAIACGIRTNNSYVGMGPDRVPCMPISRRVAAKNYTVIIATTDTNITAPTPAAFFAHSPSRHNHGLIEQYRRYAPMKTVGNLSSLEVYADTITWYYRRFIDDRGFINNRPFFWMLEVAQIDWMGHANDFWGMVFWMNDFVRAVQIMKDFVAQNPEVTLIVTSDHECGGLTEDCEWTSFDHTTEPVPLWAFGKHADRFRGNFALEDLHDKMRDILLP